MVDERSLFAGETQLSENIEVKARLRSLQFARRVAAELATGRLGDEQQRDTYFVCRTGRLKLREINHGQAAQLIWYQRSDRSAPRSSRYLLAPVVDVSLMKTVLTQALGVRATVDKRREIYLFQHIRIHLDVVQGLGGFLEFEAVQRAGESLEASHRYVAQLRERFRLEPADLCAQSYGDMLVSQ